MRRPPHRVDGRDREWEPHQETGGPAEKDDHDVNERREAKAHQEAKAHREVQERPKAAEDREAAGHLEVECPNSPKKGLTA